MVPSTGGLHGGGGGGGGASAPEAFHCEQIRGEIWGEIDERSRAPEISGARAAVAHAGVATRRGPEASGGRPCIRTARRTTKQQAAL